MVPGGIDCISVRYNDEHKRCIDDKMLKSMCKGIKILGDSSVDGIPVPIV